MYPVGILVYMTLVLRFRKMQWIDQVINLCEKAETIDIATVRIHRILREYLGSHILNVQWVPRLLTFDNKRNPKTIRRNICMCQFGNMDKSAIHQTHTRDSQNSGLIKVSVYKDGHGESFIQRDHVDSFLGCMRCRYESITFEKWKIVSCWQYLTWI